MAIKILALAGSLRSGSYNKKLAALGAAALTKQGAVVELLDLRELQLPLYDGDVEDAQGLPPTVVAFKRKLSAAQGFWFASPEYNGSVSGVFKNAIDWASRGEENVFEGKVAALCGASPGAYGSVRGHHHLRQILAVLGVWTLPDQLLIARAHEAFTPEGHLSNARSAEMLEGLASELLRAAARLAPGPTPA